MSLDTPNEIKGQIYQLDTVEIRKVLRYLNNTVRKVVEGVILASARHEWCHQKLVTSFNAEELEQGLLWLRGETLKKPDFPQSPPPLSAEEIIMSKSKPEPESASSDPIMKALTGAVMKEVDRKLSGAFLNLHSHPAFDGIRRDVGEIITDITKKMLDRMVAVEDALMASAQNNLTIVFSDTEKRDLGTVHKQQALLIKYLAAGCHVFLTGPAGSGKSTAGEKSAEALGVTFGAVSCCSQDTVTKFMGYMDAAGTYHTTEFREAYAKGGVFVIDEMDAGNPNVLAVLNSALSNSQCAFPDGMVKRHPKFRCIATGNTWGTGKTIQYVGRNAIDAATLNRFVVIYWDYDENLETKIAGMPAWSKHVQACRAEVKRRGINFLITPRASINGANALKAGIPLEDVMDNILFPNLDPEVKKAMPKPPAIQEIK